MSIFLWFCFGVVAVPLMLWTVWTLTLRALLGVVRWLNRIVVQAIVDRRRRILR